MEDWIKIRRYMLEEMIFLENHLVELNKINSSGLDDLNKDNLVRAIENTQNRIDLQSEQIKSIDKLQ